MKCKNNVNIIEVINLTKDYGKGRGVFDVSFNIKKGECFGFLGPNGAGKSTTIRHLLGFSKPDKGRCLINNLDVIKDNDEVLKDVGYLPGEIVLPNNMCGRDFIKIQADLKHLKDFSRVNFLINLFHINLDMNCKEMSLGMKRKIAILNCFMANPNILILDEPSSGLDLEMQRVFIDLIKEEIKRGKTILLSSHLFNEVKDACSRVAIIKSGRIVANFSSEEINGDNVKTFEITFKYKEDYEKFINDFKYDEIIKKDRNNYNLLIRTSPNNLTRLIVDLSNFDILNFKQKRITLEEKFLSYY